MFVFPLLIMALRQNKEIWNITLENMKLQCKTSNTSDQNCVLCIYNLISFTLWYPLSPE